MLTFLTKMASGYWHLMDPQNGYAAISRNALERINLDLLYPGTAIVMIYWSSSMYTGFESWMSSCRQIWEGKVQDQIWQLHSQGIIFASQMLPLAIEDEISG